LYNLVCKAKVPKRGKINMTDFKAVLLEQEMSRKKFLSYIGLAMLTLFGLNNFISLLQGKQIPGQHLINQPDQNPEAFGTRKFGV
jgi:hypothetical protein